MKLISQPIRGDKHAYLSAVSGPPKPSSVMIAPDGGQENPAKVRRLYRVTPTFNGVNSRGNLYF